VDSNTDPFKEFHTDIDSLQDLYLACEGVIRKDGVLDVSKLNELSKEEQAIFDMPKMKTLSAHVASGCEQCVTTIQGFDTTREMVRQATREAEKPRAFTAQKLRAFIT